MQDNLLDIRHNENLYWIIDDGMTISRGEVINDISVAIFAYIYYDNTLSEYIDKLKKLDLKIDLYIISSDEEILKKSEELLENRANCFFILKNNRGRDVSALLVAARQYIVKYDFFCFIHDKRVKKSEETSDTELWINNIQNNLIASNEYVINVIKEFKQNEKIGILAPPEPVGDHIYAYYHNSWDHNFELMLELKRSFGLECNLDRKKAPITIGTVFWARTVALKKLFEKDWKYTDFPDEPFPDDGSISHAIERSFGYFAQDAGYSTGTIMTSQYATLLINKTQAYMREIFDYLEVNEGIKNISMLRDRRSMITDNSIIMRNRHNLYVYGAGRVAMRILLELFRKGVVPKKILVSTKNDIDNLYGVPIEVCTNPKQYADGIIIIGVGNKLRKEVIDYLDSIGLKNYVDY